MDATVPVYLLTCRWCCRRCYVCVDDYEGQEYCGAGCRAAAQAASHRASSARYVRSLGGEGKRDRRDDQRARRQRKAAESTAVADDGREEVALEGKWPALAMPIAPTPDAVEVAARSHDGT
jgi:hypothetical protein